MNLPSDPIRLQFFLICLQPFSPAAFVLQFFLSFLPSFPARYFTFPLLFIVFFFFEIDCPPDSYFGFFPWMSLFSRRMLFFPYGFFFLFALGDGSLLPPSRQPPDTIFSFSPVSFAFLVFSWNVIFASPSLVERINLVIIWSFGSFGRAFVLACFLTALPFLLLLFFLAFFSLFLMPFFSLTEDPLLLFLGHRVLALPLFARKAYFRFFPQSSSFPF